ncbi:hypothetical protein [Haloarchaeobius sp. TZWWS8]|uniref:hypothetical protein n=1 Tax=Haloarchaeobius sp. TZWWS8 TaxID=3446121 RepID=UPI003EB69D7D
MSPSLLLAVLLAGGLAGVHLFAGRILTATSISRHHVHSLAGGISVAYVFVHILPELTEPGASEHGGGETASLLHAVGGEHAIFLVTLAGFASFYGLEQLARHSRRTSPREPARGKEPSGTSTGVFWLHVGSFAVYNAIIGYLLLHREEGGVSSLVLYATAMAVHLVVTDYGLREHHRSAYVHVGRWLLAASILVGVAIGLLVGVPSWLLDVTFAFVAGGVILNVVKEEVPEGSESRFWTFGIGVALYTTVLLSV